MPRPRTSRWRRLAGGATAALTWFVALPPSSPEAAEASPEIQDVRALQASWADGVTYRDETIPLELRPRALAALDYRRYDPRNVRSSGLRLDRALIGIDGRAFERFTLRVLADLRGTDTRNGLEEAWGSFEALPRALRFTGGLLIVPLSIEYSFPEATLPFIDYAFPAFVTGRTDFGLGIDGEFAEGGLSYALTATGGEGHDLNGNSRNDPQISGRVVAYPFRRCESELDLGVYEIPIFSGIFVSAAASHSWGYDSPFDVPNSFRNKLVTTSGIEADRSFAYHFGYGLDLGPFRIIHETVHQTLRGVSLPDGTKRDFEGQNASWSASFAWRITGEPYDSRPYRQREHPPALPTSPLYRDGRWGPGAIEVAVRYANVEIDRDLIDLGFTSTAIMPNRVGISSQESRTFDVALNWIPWTPLRITFQLTRTIADQRPAVFDSHGRDTSFLVRGQVSY